MALSRGKFGIEYNPRQWDDESSGLLGWILALVALLVALSLTWTIVKRIRTSRAEAVVETVSREPSGVSEKKTTTSSTFMTNTVVPATVRSTYSKRPAKVRNLLMRLEEAERRKDVEMAVSTIETIRSLPGSPAADLDDALARRLGQLNVRRLFDEKNAQWVKKVTVRRGDSASRIAAEHGSTLSSLARLNGGIGDRITIGSTLYVMNHPRFNLVIHRRTRTADLSLNGKFFKRYDLSDAIAVKEGVYSVSEKKRAFLLSLGIRPRTSDLSELETLLPTGASVLVSEM